jgi:2-dehydropantoate 2-reductase
MFANTATMGHYRPSMLVDYDEKRPLEVDAILGEPVRRAQAAGLDVPHLDMNLHLLSMLDRLNRGEVV